MRTNAETFVKIVQMGHPWGPNLLQNSKFWQFWGLYSHISALINMKFGLGELPHANFTFIGETCRPSEAKNPFLNHWL